MTGTTGQSGNHNILAREQPSTGAITGYYSDGRPIVTFTANAVDTIPAGSVYNVMDYGAVGDGVTLDRTAIQAATDACGQAGGGVVTGDALSYLIEAPVQVNYDNVRFAFPSWGSELLADTGFLGAELLIVNAPTSGYRYGIRVQELTMNGNNVAGVGGVTLVSTYHALLDHVRVYQCPGTGVYLNGSSSAFGAYTTIRDCAISNGGAGVGILSNNHEWSLITGGLIDWYNSAGGVGIKLVNGNFRVLGVGFDECDTGILISFANRNIIADCMFERGGTQFISLIGTDNVIAANHFGTRSGTGTNVITFPGNSGTKDNAVTGCAVVASSGWVNFIQESNGIGTPGNTYTGNDTGGLPIVLYTGVARGNRGYNPVGYLSSQPAIPATTVAYTNASGVDCTVYVTGGTVTAIAVGGSATGATSGAFRVAAGQTIALTYSVAPSWSWFGE